MEGIWDLRADAVQKGDKLRDVSPIIRKTRIDDKSYTNYTFSRQLFKTSSYIIPDDEFELFKMFLDGKALIYPSDGDIPSNIVAVEVRKVLNYIVAYSENLSSPYYEDANIALKNGKKSLVRGALKLYLGKYTTIDWRKKRFTDKINFWTFQVGLLDHVLKRMGWIKNNETGELEKNLEWTNPETGEVKHEAVCTANNLYTLLDFTAEIYLEGSTLREIFNKNLKRGYDVDLSDIINVALCNDGKGGKNREEWNEVWVSFELATNTRNTRITSNIISLCRYSLGIADHLERVSFALVKYHDKIFNKKEYPDEAIKRICRSSTNWIEYFAKNGPDATKKMIHEFLLKQKDEKLIQVKNLRRFVKNVLKILNLKYEYLKITFEIEN
jgi:hypothetical protein